LRGWRASSIAVIKRLLKAPHISRTNAEGQEGGRVEALGKDRQRRIYCFEIAVDDHVVVLWPVADFGGCRRHAAPPFPAIVRGLCRSSRTGLGTATRTRERHHPAFFSDSCCAPPVDVEENVLTGKVAASTGARGVP
jgi:hypothetical protein